LKKVGIALLMVFVSTIIHALFMIGGSWEPCARLAHPGLDPGGKRGNTFRLDHGIDLSLHSENLQRRVIKEEE